jgi:hypothetical protein
MQTIALEHTAQSHQSQVKVLMQNQLSGKGTVQNQLSGMHFQVHLLPITESDCRIDVKYVNGGSRFRIFWSFGLLMVVNGITRRRHNKYCGNTKFQNELLIRLFKFSSR